eukprot:301356_1
MVTKLNSIICPCICIILTIILIFSTYWIVNLDGLINFITYTNNINDYSHYQPESLIDCIVSVEIICSGRGTKHMTQNLVNKHIASAVFRKCKYLFIPDIFPLTQKHQFEQYKPYNTTISYWDLYNLSNIKIINKKKHTLYPLQILKNEYLIKYQKK